nr:hypothetical protein [Tanacetum cinerariifolium]
DPSLPADALPTALSPSYVVNSDPEEDEKDPKEDPAYYPADRGDNDDDESSNDDDDDDDVEKEEDDKEEEDHLAPADFSDETMTTVNQGLSVEEIKRVVAQRVANAIEAIAIYEAKTNIALKSMSQTKRQKEKSVEEIKRVVAQRVANAIEAIAIYECGNCKKVGHIIQNCRTPATAKNQRTRTCYECGSLRHCKSECPIVKFHKRVDMIHGR